MTSTRDAGPTSAAAIERALGELEGGPVEVVDVAPLAGDRGDNDLKRAGYGVPLVVRYRAGGALRRVVFRTQSSNWYGHDRRADRAYLCLLAADGFGDQPRHVAALDVGALRGGDLVSLRGAGEFYLLTEYVDGALYADDLREVERARRATQLDVARAEALADHLTEVHASKPPRLGGEAEQLHARAMRDLLGSGEGIFGIVDGYPRDFADAARLRRIEELSLAWRWRVKDRGVARACRTHGDFHPYNILFRTGVDFTVLDASRGGVGDPADDLAALGINFLFGGLRCPDAWELGFGKLWSSFFDRYVSSSGNARALDLMAPFLAWRALVLASPVWYPGITAGVRRGLLDAAIRWLEAERLDASSIAGLAVGDRLAGRR